MLRAAALALCAMVLSVAAAAADGEGQLGAGAAAGAAAGAGAGDTGTTGVSAAPYVEHAGCFCEGNQAHGGAANNHTFAQTAEPLAACTAHCLATSCSCFDVDPGSCRLTNWSTAVQKSSEGFTAYVNSRKPHHTPPPPPPPHGGGAPIGKSGAARYGCTGEHATQPFCDVTLPTAERVAKLIALLSPEEKGSLMAARTTDWTNAIDRLGVPLFCWGQNSAQGYLQTSLPPTGGGITTFPRAPGMAATWNMSAVKAQGAVFATEARSLFNQGGFRGTTFSCPGSIVLWGPTINLNRDPRWGRNGETSSEDPWFNGLYGAAYAEGAQYDPVEPGVLKTIVTLKHWGAYSVDLYRNATTTAFRQSFDAKVSAFDMADSYAPVFAGAVRGHNSSAVEHGASYRGALGVMCSCACQPLSALQRCRLLGSDTVARLADNSVNGRPACASREMQTEMLRGNWSFPGYVVGDSDTVKFIHTGNGKDVDGHAYVDTPAKAVRLALEAGTDLESAGGNDAYYRDYIPAMLRNGSLPPMVVDLALTRMLSLRFRAGLFDEYGRSFDKITPSDRGTAELAEVALDAARQSMTLLLNKKKALPIRPKSSVLVIGPYSSYGSEQGGVGGKLSKEIGRINGAEAAVVKGCGIAGADKSGFAAAVAAVAKAETIVLALGADPTKEHESMDRLDVTLPAIQSELALVVLSAAKAAAHSKKVVLVLFNWGEISTEELLGPLDALLMAYMPHTSTAVAEVLSGTVNPSAKLPYTVYPNNYTDNMDFLDMSLTAGLGRGYRFYKGEPLFAFGLGLSYSSFVFSASATVFGACATAASGGCASKLYSVQVSNRGPMAGSEVVQLYSSPIATSLGGWKAPLPKRKLIDFAKVAVAVGDSATVSFTVTDDMLRLTDVDGVRRLVPGRYNLAITDGNGQVLNDVYEVKANARLKTDDTRADCDVLQHGALGDNITDDGAAIQRAIYACAGAGRGAVLLRAPHSFASSPLELPSHTKLVIEPGAVLTAILKINQWPNSSHGETCSSNSNEASKVLRPSKESFLWSGDTTDVTITGGGEINGRGAHWLHGAVRKEPWWHTCRPNLVAGRNLTRFNLHNITLHPRPERRQLHQRHHRLPGQKHRRLPHPREGCVHRTIVGDQRR